MTVLFINTALDVSVKRIRNKPAIKLSIYAGSFAFTVIVALVWRWIAYDGKFRWAGFEPARRPRLAGGHLFMPCLDVGFYKLLPDSQSLELGA
jgi:hypothetical protein